MAAKVRVPAVVIYNPVNNNNEMYNRAIFADCSNTTVNLSGVAKFNASATGNPGSSIGDGIIFNWTSDARLGV